MQNGRELTRPSKDGLGTDGGRRNQEQGVTLVG
jgi:hypothetical protein